MTNLSLVIMQIFMRIKAPSACGSEQQEGELLPSMDSCKRPFIWGVKYLSHHRLTFPTSQVHIFKPQSCEVVRAVREILTNFLPRWKAWPFISCGKCISYLIIQFQDHAKWRFWLNFSVKGAREKHHEWFFRWGSLGSLSLSAACLLASLELLSFGGLQGLCTAELRELHIFFSLLLPHLFLSLTLPHPCSKELQKVDWVMGAAVNQIAVSKVMLCFTLAPHKSHRAWHLSGCRSEMQHPPPVTQTPRSPCRGSGWLVSLSRNEVIPFC